MTDLKYRLMFWEIQDEHRYRARKEYIQDCIEGLSLPIVGLNKEDLLSLARQLIERFCKKRGYKLTATKPACYATGRPNSYYGFEISVGRTPRKGTIVTYVSGSNKEYEAVVGGIPESPDCESTDLPIISLAFRDYRGKGIKKARVLPAEASLFATQVWKPIFDGEIT